MATTERSSSLFNPPAKLLICGSVLVSIAIIVKV
uniref:Uncharacterized protein n=2 Tax=Viruses TaxID=10239 RepID=A0A8S5NLL5_9CAUD|nr:MAG TPA: hypothetical protein [Podoviridae sp. ctsNK10]DAE29112.1 MAG TPA: hypothetical protein [virus sp. ctx9V1]DAE50165.1 MAG TPA: hypothetical protein [Bacteriophage sp.]DAJ73328.1 MAG TPA: hypothetical protein [Caudoviricetes sp.]DAO74268.1 MAG TPA: hypothetical protein [Bacteriophage sp.]